MINKVYRLTRPYFISEDLESLELTSDKILVKPTVMSICVADQRYYKGLRPSSILESKLPMSLIHEAIGEVVYDPSNRLKVGQTVVLIPNTPSSIKSNIKENYDVTSKFRASSMDGFMQEYVLMDKDRVIPINSINKEIGSFIEMVSVAVNAIENFDKLNKSNLDTVGIWGSGSLGFILSLLLKYKYVNSKIIVFGRNKSKLEYFSFVDEIYEIDNIPQDLQISHAFEAVGGKNSEYAISQIIDIIQPQGVVSLLGVSEDSIKINTRKVLEKGLYLLGNSRSSRIDFELSVEILEKNKDIQNQLSKLISSRIEVRNIVDINKAFELDFLSEFKTIIHWKI